MGGLWFLTVGLVWAMVMLTPMQYNGKNNVNMNGEPFPSNEPFWPASVSATIHESYTPAGKIATAGVVVGAILMFIAAPATWLSNVNVGDGLCLFPCCYCPALTMCNMVNVRNILLPAGVLLVIFAPVADVEGNT